MKELEGMGVALVTPFTADNKVDVESLKKLVRFQIENGTDYLVVLGTTAETATLSKQEKELVITTIVNENNGALPLVLGIGGNNTLEVVNELQSRDVSAFSAILSVVPYYNKPSQQGIYEHFKAVSQASPKPIMLYNIPSRSGVNMLPETICKLAYEFDNIVAVKEAAGDMIQALELLKNKPSDFQVISGDDMIALAMTLAGGSGVVSVLGQAYPSLFSEMIQLALKGQSTEAYRIHFQFMDAISLIFKEGNPTGVKYLLQELELINDSSVRLPLVPASEELQEAIKSL